MQLHILYCFVSNYYVTIIFNFFIFKRLWKNDGSVKNKPFLHQRIKNCNKNALISTKNTKLTTTTSQKSAHAQVVLCKCNDVILGKTMKDMTSSMPCIVLMCKSREHRGSPCSTAYDDISVEFYRSKRHSTGP